MKRETTIFAIIFIFSSLMIACGASKSDNKETEAPKTSQEHVETASFTDLAGDTVDIADFKGKVVMIDFWETWCKPCLASFPTFDKLQQEYADDFVILAVTPGFTDTKQDARNFSESHDYSFQYLMDTQSLHEKLEVQSIPYKVFIDAEGNFIKSSMGSYGSDQDYKKVKAIIENNRQKKVSGNSER